MIGKRIAHYEVSARLGAGGMGEVFLARDTKLGREVALKLLPAEMSADETARARLLNEARTASSLNHPHICTIFEVGEAEGRAYIALEHVEGKPLAAMVPEGGLPTDAVLRYGTQIADALAHAHDRGVIHRDLKTSNVMITPEGRAKVLDFGLAKKLRDEDLAEVTRSGKALTQAGAVVGTLHSMAPELLSGNPADARSDIWALGILLYEAAAGALPFQGKTGFEMTSAILREPPRILPERVPAGLRAVIQRCLAKEPGQRYQRASEVRAALEAIGSSGFAEVIAPVSARPRWAWLAALGGLALLVIGSAVWRPWNRAENSGGAGGSASGAPPSKTGTAFLIRRPSSNAEANELLQRAMMFTRYQLDPLRARQMLVRALELDPKFTEARVNYALTYIIAVETGVSNESSDIYRAEEELRHALKEEPALARAHALLGAVHFFQGRIDLATEESQRSVQLSPGDLAGRMWLLIEGRFLGDTEEAMRETRKLIAAEPLFWPPRNLLGEVLREEGNMAEAVREYEKVLEQDPQNVSALRCLVRTHLDAGNLPQARQALERLRPQDFKNFRVRLVKAQLDAVEGKRALTLKEMDESVLKYADLMPFAALDAAEVYALLGEKEKAIEWLDRSMRKGDNRGEWFQRDPLLKNVREHPRFKQILDSIAYRREQRKKQ